MPTWESRIQTGVRSALGAYWKACSEENRKNPTIDLRVLAGAVGSIRIEEREMIPEAAIGVSGSEFRIYLRSNFLNQPGERIRQRFSLAHEIAHTFFFERTIDSWRVCRDAPRGQELEAACHEGAAQLLLPDRVLPNQFDYDRVTGEFVVELARRADVSLDVVLRRLRTHAAIQAGELAFVLCRGGRITYVTYPPWLQSVLPKRPQSSLQSWLQAEKVILANWIEAAGFVIETVDDGSMICEKEDAEAPLGRFHIAAKRFRTDSSAQLYELRRYLALNREEVRARLASFRVE